MTTRKLLITGKNGYVAESLYAALKNAYEVTNVGRNELDLSNPVAVNDWFEDKEFDTVIHTAIQGGYRLHKDDMSVMDTNLKMYYNLLDNKKNYGKFINIGSGAELFSTDTPYGLSKLVIQRSCLNMENFYNIRAFSIFDENERDVRFIKSNIVRYLNNDSMQLRQDKKMDFFYMKDFVSLITHYIENTDMPKEIDCTYSYSPFLSDILSMINSLGPHTVPIINYGIGASDNQYTGTYHDLGLKYIGMEAGIQEVYNKLYSGVQ